MKRNKRGFTLGEILVCIMVVGVIMALSLQTLKIVRASYTALGYFAFKNMEGITRELYSGQTAKSQTSSIMLCKTSDGKNVHVLKPDIMPTDTTSTPWCYNLDVGSGTNTVCNNLAKMVNTSGKINCDSLFTASISTEDDEPYISDFNYLNPTFITTNGQRYFITARAFDTTVSSEYGFRLIAIDLNGKSQPNSMEVSYHRMPPDVITFLLMDNGEMYPLGVAADNFQLTDSKTIQYISSRAKGYYYSYNSERTTGIPDDCYVKKKSGEEQICNYAVVPIKNISGKSLYSYREAYCNALGENKNPAYTNYCYNMQRNSLCPPSSEDKRFDLCRVENVKPLFRYNFN